MKQEVPYLPQRGLDRINLPLQTPISPELPPSVIEKGGGRPSTFGDDFGSYAEEPSRLRDCLITSKREGIVFLRLDRVLFRCVETVVDLKLVA